MVGQRQGLSWSLLTAGQWGLLTLLVLPLPPACWSWWPLPLVILGTAVHAWAVISLRVGLGGQAVLDEVCRRGPFGCCRHPMYVGELLLALGLCLAWGGGWRFAPLVLLLPLLAHKAHLEEAALLRSLPGYADYRRQVPAWLPLPRCCQKQDAKAGVDAQDP